MKIFNDMMMGEFCVLDFVIFIIVIGGLLDVGKDE